MHYATEKSSWDEIVFSHFLLSLSSKVKILNMINHFQCILYRFNMNLNLMSYNQCILMKVYTHFYANTFFKGLFDSRSA